MFELTLTKAQLLAPLLTVASVVDKKQVLPVLSNILFSLKKNYLQLCATDLEMEVTARIPYKGDIEAAITIPAKKLIDIIRSFDENATITINVEKNTVLLTAGHSQFKLATLPATDFPASALQPSDVELVLTRTALNYLLQSTQFALSLQDLRVFLNSLLLEFDKESITAVATDGHRIAICRLNHDRPGSFFRFLLSRKVIYEIVRFINCIQDENVIISAGKGYFKLTTENYIFQSRLINARFPSYAKALPRHHDKQIRVDRERLKRALSRIVILANEKSHAIVLHMQANGLTLVANNQEQEEAMEILPAETIGEEIRIAVNANYLLDVLNVINEAVIKLSFSTVEEGILIESVESLKNAHYQYVIMPMKL